MHHYTLLCRLDSTDRLVSLLESYLVSTGKSFNLLAHVEALKAKATLYSQVQKSGALVNLYYWENPQNVLWNYV